MRTWQQYLTEKKNVKYEFSSTQINLPSDLAEDIIKWSKNNIPEDDLYVKDGEFGREDEIHVTVLYGTHTNDPDDIKKVLENQKPIKYTLRKISIFSSPDYDVVKIDVTGKQLHDLNAKLKKNLEHTSTHPVYQPHVTLAYVKKGAGKKYVGNSKFYGNTITGKELVFSSEEGLKTKININHG